MKKKAANCLVAQQKKVTPPRVHLQFKDMHPKILYVGLHHSVLGRENEKMCRNAKYHYLSDIRNNLYPIR
jgi:hypothetical protein